MVTVRVGYDRRCWATFEVKDPTEAELLVLAFAFESDREDAQQAAAELLAEMQKDDRLVLSHEDEDDNPDYFADYAEPAVVDLDKED